MHWQSDNKTVISERRLFWILLAVLVVTMVGLLLTPAGAPEPGYEPASSCQEDDPCWDCSTMGNQVCGVMP